MRRRSKRGPNESESTGKIGREIPSDQPTPLQPMYPESSQARRGEGSGTEKLPEKPKGRSAAEKLIDRLMPKPAATHAPEEPVHEPPLDQTLERRDRGEDRGAGRSAPEEPGVEVSSRPEVHEAEPAEERAAPRIAAEEPSPVEGKLVVETQPESPSLPPPELPPASPRNPKGYVVLTIGLPGSGKTTWFKRRGVMPLSSDMLRSILFDDITEQRYQGLVFSTLRSLLRARLIAKMPWNYVDATNLSPHERRQWIKMAKSFGYEVQAVFFDVPLEICMERNRRRERVVSEEIMRKMAERLRPPSFKEGFSKITMVRVKGASPVAVEPDGSPQGA